MLHYSIYVAPVIVLWGCSDISEELTLIYQSVQQSFYTGCRLDMCLPSAVGHVYFSFRCVKEVIVMYQSDTQPAAQTKAWN